MVYTWKVSKYTVPAQTAGEELERIEQKHGIVTPGNVLEESRPAQAALHSIFEWNDSAAAERFRLEQAREIIGNIAVVRIIEDQPREPVRAFVNIIPADRERGYMSIVKVLSSQEYTRQMLQSALADFLALRKKYGMLTELSDLFEMIDQLHGRYSH